MKHATRRNFPFKLKLFVPTVSISHNETFKEKVRVLKNKNQEQTYLLEKVWVLCFGEGIGIYSDRDSVCLHSNHIQRGKMYHPLKAMLSASGVVQLLYIKSKWLMGCTLKSHTTPFMCFIHCSTTHYKWLIRYSG